MGKAVKAAVKVFVVTFAITTGLAFVFNSASLFALGQVGLTGAFLGGVSTLTIASLSAASTLVGGLMSKGTNATAENFGTKVATRTSAAPRQIIYGKARVGGTITHIETSGTDNYKLSMIVVLAGHEVESLEEVLINDTKLTTTSSGGFQYATNSRFTNSENENKFGVSNSLLRYKFKDGSQTTADSTITGATSLGSTDKFIGMAYMLIEMVFDSEAFGGGIPPMAFVIKGKKVYDPRTSTTAWSDNPALCVRDFITDTTYGLKATSDEVLDTTALGGFASAANTCENQAGAITTATVNGAVTSLTTIQIDYAATNTLIDVGQTVTGTGISGSPTVIARSGNLITLSSAQTISDGVTLTFNEDLYKANGITNMAADGTGVLEGLLSSCAGKLSYINGKFVMFAGATVTPDMTITDDNLLAPISVATKNSGGETFNTVKAVYVDANNNYVATDSPVYTDSTLIANDTPSGESQANYRKTLELQLPFTDTTTMAQRLQRTALLHSRQEVSLSVLCNIAFMQLQPFDWVYLTNERLGYTNKTFEVLATNLEVIESDDVPILATRLVLKEIDSSVYSFASSSYTNPIDEGSSVSTGSFTVTAPTNLSVSATLVNTGYDLQVQWTNNTDDLIQGTEILYGTSSGTYISSAIAGKGKTKEIIPNVKPNSTYYIVARHFSANNVFSAVTSEVTISTSSGTGINTPSAPTSLSATTGKPLNIGLSWTNPSNSDLRDIKIYRSTSSGFTPNDGTNLVRTIAGVPSVSQKVSFGIDDGLVAGTTYYFKVKAVSFFDKESSASSQASGSFTKVEATDIDAIFSGYFHVEGSTTTALTDSAFNTAHGRLPIEDDILIMVNTSASTKVSKAYKYSGTSGSGGSFVEITNFQTGDLIVDGTIAGSKIIADTVNGNVFQATTTITAGTGNNVGVLDGADSTFRIYAGNSTPASAPFRVSQAGALTSTSATITGSITATSLNVTNATVTGTLDASVITLDGDPLDDLFGVSGTGSAKTLAIGPDTKNQLKVDGTSMQYVAYDQTQSNGDLAFDMDEDRVLFYPTTNRISWTPTYITGGDIENNNDNAGIRTPNLTVGYSSLNQTYNLAVAGDAFFNSPVVLDTVTTPTTTTNKLYNVGGTLYFNGSAVGGGGTGDITGVTITTTGGSLTGGAAYTSGDATFTLDIGSTITGAKTFDNNVVIQGNLDVQGTTTTIDTTNLDVKDKNITLNYGTGDTSANANGAGITIQDAVSAGNDATLTWNTSNDSFNFSHDVNVTGGLTTNEKIIVNQPSSNTVNELLILEANDIYSDVIQTDTGGSVRLRTNSGAYRIYTGGAATSQTASGATQALILDSSQNATFAGTINSGAITSTGNITLAEYLYHSGNTGTNLRFQTDRATLTSGGGASVDAHSNGNLYLTGTTVQVYGNYNSTGTISSGSQTITSDTYTKIYSSTNGASTGLRFSDHVSGSYAQYGDIRYYHADGSSYGSGNAFVFNSTESTTTILADGKLMFKEGLYLKPSSGTGAGTQIIDSSRNLLNIGTISSGAITSTGSSTFTSTSVMDINLVANPPELNFEDTSSTSGTKRARWTLDSNNFSAQGLSDNDGSVTQSLLSFALSSGAATFGGSINSGAITTSGHIQQNNAYEIRSKDTGGTVRTIMRVNSSNELEYGWSGNGKVKIMGGGSYTERFSIGTDGNATFSGTINSGSITSTGDISGATIEGYVFPSYPSQSGGVLTSDVSGNMAWSFNTVSSYVNTGDDKIVTSTGSTGIRGESNLTYNEADGLKITDSLPKLSLIPTSSSATEIILDSSVQGFINFKDGATTDASIGYEGVFNNKLSISCGNGVTFGSSNLTTTGTISSGSITVDPSGTYGDGITINAGDTSTAAQSAKQIIMSFGGTSPIDYAHSIRTRHNSSADTGNTVEVYLWDYGTDSSTTIGTKRALVLENSTGLDLLTGGYKVGGTTVIDSSRNLTNIGTISSGDVTTTGINIGSNTGDAFNGQSVIRIQDGGNAYVQIKAGTAAAGGFLVGDTDDDFVGGLIYSNSTNSLTLTSGNAVALTLDSSQNATFAGNINLTSGHGYQINGTTVIDSSREIQNVTFNNSFYTDEYGKSLVGNFGQFQAHSTYSDFNTNVNMWGWNFVQGNGNNPAGISSQWYRQRISLGDAYGYGTDSGDYWMELALPRYGNGVLSNSNSNLTRSSLWVRTCEGGSIQSWSQIGGDLYNGLSIRGTDVIDSSRNLTNIGNITSTGVLDISAGTNNIPVSISGSNSSYTSVAIKNTGSGSATLWMDASNGDLAGSDYASIKQTNSLQLVLRTEASAGSIILEPAGTAALTLDTSQNATFAGTISSGAITNTGNITTSGNIVHDRVIIDDYSSGTVAVDVGRIQIRSVGKTGWAVGDELGSIDFYNSDGSGIGARNAARIVAENNNGNGSTTTTFEGELAFYTSAYNSNLNASPALLLDGSNNATFAGTISSGQLQVNTGATNTTAVFESTDDKAFIQIKDNDTNAHLIAKDGNFSIADDSGTFDTFRIDLDTGNVDISGTFDGGSITATDSYGGGSGDYTNITTPQLKIVAEGTGYWRIPHISGHSTISGVYNYQTGKDVYWGEPNDTGLYRFRGRNLRIEGGSLQIGSTAVIDSSRNLTNIGTITLSNGGHLQTYTSDGSSGVGGVDLPRGGHITFYGNNSNNHSIGSRNHQGSVTDDLRISSYGAIYFDLDSNNNNGSSADFVIGRHGSGTGTISNLFSISGETGAVVSNSNITAYGSASDIRLKENIEVIQNPIDKVQRLRGVTFNYKKDGSKSTGLIAQELEEVLPEVVYETHDLHDEEDKYKAVRYGNIVGLLVEAIKEQQKQIDELKARLDNDSSK